jgi:hypothetical protein
MGEENKQSRKERNAELKAKYEAEKAEKKAKREAKKAERANKDSARSAPKRALQQPVVAEPEQLDTPEVIDLPPRHYHETGDETTVPAEEAVAAKVEHTSWENAAREESSAWEEPAGAPQPTRREQREEKKAQKLEAELKKSGKKRKKRSGLPAEVSKMLMEKKLILAQWRSRKIDPNQAVERLSALVATCEDGSTWRLLPRPGGAALVKTLEDGTTEIIEPPQRRRPLVTLFIAVLFGAFVAVAIWSSFDPVTSGVKSTTTTTTSVTETDTAGG